MKLDFGCAYFVFWGTGYLQNGDTVDFRLQGEPAARQNFVRPVSELKER